MMTYTKCVPLRLNAMFILYCWRVMFSVDIKIIIKTYPTKALLKMMFPFPQVGYVIVPWRVSFKGFGIGDVS